MIIEVNVAVHIIAKEGKLFNWERPSNCPFCNHSILYGHGYQPFGPSETSEIIYLKRYRCQNEKCKRTVTLKPVGFLKKYQSLTLTIFNILIYRLSFLCWPKSCPRQRGGHWLKKFINKMKMDFSTEKKSLIDLLKFLFLKKIPFF